MLLSLSSSSQAFCRMEGKAGFVLDEIRKLVNYQYLFLLRFTDFKKEDRLVNLPLYAVEQIVDL